ncbi:glycosyltransferase [Sphingomonas sp. PAMC 26605]|uniref:glycosyltransferase n=1 Tax=Sphingomonas sp. PAMC 26605 TaxID=1112214 RepID=UPI00026CAB8C|nr:glycosyltransferase [Sphingomonas sp. PAMC 26605]
MTDPTSGTLQYLTEKEGSEFVQACYRDILQRDADPVGLDNNLAALANGTSKARILAAIANSDEACLNNMAGSRLARSARRRAYLENSGLVWPLKAMLAPLMARKWANSIEARRAVLLERIDASPEDAPVGTRQAVEAVRLSISNWRDEIARSRISTDPQQNHAVINNLWFDMTTAFQWTGGVVGIVRAELEMACGLARTYPNIRFSMQIDQGFAEIPKHELRWLLDADNVADAYMHFFARYKGAIEKTKTIHVQTPDVEGFFHPYEAGDAVIAMGWMDSQKERLFALAKDQLGAFYLFYLVYDIIMLLNETKHFYDPIGRERFERYIEWISHNCDMIFYGGRTAQIDTEALQRSRGWPSPRGVPVKFGTDIVKNPGTNDDMDILKGLGITGEFIITVGSLEPRKNHETLYRAYLMALEMENDDLCQLVFIGKPMWRVDDMMDTISRDPRLKGKLLRLTPTDMELAALYKNCRFTVLPSIYEGWSLTLPESLGQGKFCLCSDTPPLREIGRDLVDYVDTYDVRGWAEKIILYAKDDALLQTYEAKIASGWPSMKWSDTAREMLDAAFAFVPSHSPPAFDEPPVIWMDMTMSFLEWQGGISGIVRAELEYAKHLKALDPRTRFFAYQRVYNYFFEIDDSYLMWLFDSTDLATSYANFHEYWNEHEGNSSGFRNPFRQGQDGMPFPEHAAYLPTIPRNSIVFFAGIDSDENGNLSRIPKISSLFQSGRSILQSQLIYDLTPVLTPQFHTPTTCIGFRTLFDHVSNKFDHIVYGGRTAQRDGIAFEEREHWKVPASDFVEFGADLGSIHGATDSQRDAEILQHLGIDSDFVITVGTIEPRKNHEALYKAYLIMLRKNLLKKPLQMIFVGKRGWKSSDFLDSFSADERVRDKIIILSPTDEELSVLYRNCKFTLLPSFYEGWSLTLPESLSYGKFCLTSDVDPLRETGRDLVEYIHPLDTAAWAERIAFYANNEGQVTSWERKIKAQWRATTWRESSEILLEALRGAHAEKVIEHSARPERENA